jgi:ABC-type Fe3+-hydroxamate transport system substrate-binding protein
MKIRHALAVICAAAALALTACTSAPDSSDNPATTTVTETETAAPAPTDDDMTQTVVDLSWAQQTEADKDAMCFGLALYGTDWGAEQMRIGAGNESVDWDRAAVLVEAKCALR